MASELNAMMRPPGEPGYAVSDNGIEFTGKGILKWAKYNDVV
ncbi:MAG: hypothetical protein AAFY56_21405 [Pseudomonadota bacterium]